MTQSLTQALITDRFINKNQNLDESPHHRAGLVMLGIASLTTAMIGHYFFKMDTLTTAVLSGSGAALLTSGVTSLDGPLFILGSAAVVGIGLSIFTAFRKGNVHINLDIADCIRAVKELFDKNLAHSSL